MAYIYTWYACSRLGGCGIGDVSQAAAGAAAQGFPTSALQPGTHRSKYLRLLGLFFGWQMEESRRACTTLFPTPICAIDVDGTCAAVD